VTRRLRIRRLIRHRDELRMAYVQTQNRAFLKALRKIGYELQQLQRSRKPYTIRVDAAELERLRRYEEDTAGALDRAQADVLRLMDAAQRVEP
jgi:hypothetical protein